MKIHPVGAELFHADEWKDRHDEANSRFSQFYYAPQKQLLLPNTTLTDCFFYNRGETCLLCGKNWVFKQNSLRLVFEGLTNNI